jgi:hypothetical protein
MKSMEMEFHGFSRIGSCLSGPYGQWQGDLAQAQVVQDLQYCLTKSLRPG